MEKFKFNQLFDSILHWNQPKPALVGSIASKPAWPADLKLEDKKVVRVTIASHSNSTRAPHKLSPNEWLGWLARENGSSPASRLLGRRAGSILYHPTWSFILPIIKRKRERRFAMEGDAVDDTRLLSLSLALMRANHHQGLAFAKPQTVQLASRLSTCMIINCTHLSPSWLWPNCKHHFLPP